MNTNNINRIELLEEYIRNTSEKTSSILISSEAFYSYRHANRLFKALKGESIQSYSKKIRLSLGAEYLKYTSKRIFDIAIDCGYESSAAFSKAFKAVYKKSPTAFREKNNFIHLLKSNFSQYTIVHLNDWKLETVKVKMSSNIDFEGYFKNTKSAINTLKTEPKEWVLLWNDDPKLTQVSESTYYLGFNQDESYNSKSTVLNGRYVCFATDSFKEYPYEIWHELVYTIVTLKNFELRDASYIEYFRTTSLEDSTTFFPYKIAIPVQ